MFDTIAISMVGIFLAGIILNYMKLLALTKKINTSLMVNIYLSNKFYTNGLL